MTKILIIAALCARPYVQAAAKAGYQVIALDAFDDEDTRQAAQQTYRIAYANGGFDELQLMQVLRGLGSVETVGLIYGSGFEASPALLEQVAQYVPLVGNAPATLRKLKNPQQFFALLSEQDIAHPQISLTRPVRTEGWLRKQGGGSGGTHVRSVQAECENAAALIYYQRETPGLPVSLLFAANGSEVRMIGFNEQWVSATPSMPYRYGGAVGNITLPATVAQQLLLAAQRIVSAAGLVGLNSLDAIVQGEQVQVLELNPRLSATFDLYDDDRGSLIELHLRACAGDLREWPPKPHRAKAHQVVYAPHDIMVPRNFAWPGWAADLPSPERMIAASHPLCSIFAEARDAGQAKKMVRLRAQEILTAISSNMNSTERKHQV
jgi:predicted ATP-grasp superfamily ATP-dependent carboligase